MASFQDVDVARLSTLDDTPGSEARLQCRKLVEAELGNVRTATSRTIYRQGLPVAVAASSGSFYVFLESDDRIRVSVHLASEWRVECTGVDGIVSNLREETGHETSLEVAQHAVADYLKRVALHARVLDTVSRWIHAKISLKQMRHGDE